MPQFDKITFFNQLFWLLLFFFGFYLFLLHFFLPKLSIVLKARQKMLKLFLNGVSTMLNESKEVITSTRNDCSFSLGHKNSSVFLGGTFFFVEWIKINLFTNFNNSFKNGLLTAEQRVYQQTLVFSTLSTLVISDNFFSDI